MGEMPGAAAQENAQLLVTMWPWDLQFLRAICKSPDWATTVEHGRSLIGALWVAGQQTYGVAV